MQIQYVNKTAKAWLGHSSKASASLRLFGLHRRTQKKKLRTLHGKTKDVAPHARTDATLTSDHRPQVGNHFVVRLRPRHRHQRQGKMGRAVQRVPLHGVRNQHQHRHRGLGIIGHAVLNARAGSSRVRSSRLHYWKLRRSLLSRHPDSSIVSRRHCKNKR